MIDMNIPAVDSPTMTLISIIIVVVITIIITRIVAVIMNKMQRFQEDKTAMYLINDIIDYTLYFIALIVILQFFGINLAGTLLSLGIVGIAVSFAAKDIISNLFSGIILIIGKSIKVGDTVEIDGKKGHVKRVSLRSTVIIDDLGVKNIVPNSTLTNNPYLHFKPPEIYRVDIMAGLPLDVDIEDFKAYITEKMKGYEKIAHYPQPEVFAREISFKQSKLKVSFWVNNLNDKDEYKIIVTNDIRKYIEKVEL